MEKTPFSPSLTPPLAERMRPQELNEVVGQPHLLGKGKPLSMLVATDHLPSLIFWGPPGTGKTTLARCLARKSQAQFFSLSAVLSGVKELREVIERAKEYRNKGQKSILFVDEIHRWNKAQQDALLPHVEDGTVTLIGSTTENPSFEMIGALLSRTKVYVLKPLTFEEMRHVLILALQDRERGLGTFQLDLEEEALQFICAAADGDARRAITTLEIAADLARHDQKKNITVQYAENALQQKCLLYDKKGEEHYNTISAFIKSMRGSDPDAAVYYLARMLEAGEDPLFCARRMVIFASEDIGNADPQAIQVAIACTQAFERVGIAEGWIPLAQCATYLSCAPKSNASYRAYTKAKTDVEKHGALPIPHHLRNAPTTLLKTLGYGKNYHYPHLLEGNVVPGEHYLPEKLQREMYYTPTRNGYEERISLRLNQWRSLQGKKEKT